MSLKCITITREAFDAVLSRYPSLVVPALHSLDEIRFETIPQTLCERRNNRNDAYLTKEDVTSLVEWKLKHGTWRPKLLQLVKDNSEESIEQTTRRAFSASAEDLYIALKVLTALKGIGPATASLLLSVNDLEEVPFFSDELFRWLTWDEEGAPGGWKRVIKYSSKEYKEMVQRVTELRSRLGVRADDCEKVAWVLGKEKVDLDSSAASDASIQATVEKKEVVALKNSTRQSNVTPKERITKRKADETKTVTEGLRRSNRRKIDT